MADTCGPHLVLINDVLTAINAATAQAQGEEAAVIQATKGRMEGESEEGATVKVHTT